MGLKENPSIGLRKIGKIGVYTKKKMTEKYNYGLGFK
jgi:hypothetical protein